MVGTRASLRKEVLAKRELDEELGNPQQQPGVSAPSLVQAPNVEKPNLHLPSENKSLTSGTFKSKPRSKNQSCSSSIRARRKQLELEAAQEKARIQMELIDKKLVADVAALEDEDKYSSQSESVHSKQSTSKSDIERWVDHSLMNGRDQRIHEPGTNQDPLYPPKRGCSGADGSVQQLAVAIQQLVTSTVTNNQNNNLLSRMSTPRDLPIFTGDTMEWLQFQQAYEESTELCKFSDKENLWRLRKCLRGAAREAVASLLITPTTPEKVMDTLKLQFGNPDIILSKILSDLKKLSPLPPDYHKEITKFSIKITNYITAVRSLKRHDYLQGVNVTTIILSKLPTILISKWIDYSHTPANKENICRLTLLSEFLHEEAVKLSQSGANLLYLRPEKRQFNLHNETVLVQNEQSVVKNCRYCKKGIHKLTECKQFKSALRKTRWEHVKRYGLCYKCLISHHNKQTCPAPVCNAEGCAKNHHRLLHYVPRQNVIESVVEVSEPPPENVNNINANSCSVLLKVVPICIHGANGVINTSALLDDGSTVSLISAELATRAGLRGRRECLRVRGAWDSTELVCDSQLVNVPIVNKQGSMFNIIARSVNKLNLPKQDLTVINCNKYSHLQSIKNKLYLGNLQPEVLIGQDNFHLLLPSETIVGSSKDPCATRTPLGWSVHGCVGITRQQSSHSTLFISDSQSERKLCALHDEVRHYFSLESIGISARPRQNSEDIKALDILERTSTWRDGKWYVGLPWKSETCSMPDAFPTAISRLKSVEQKMKRDQNYTHRYRERIQHLLDNGYAEQLGEKDTSSFENKRIWYLPHFGVDNPNKKKLRLVFDAAARSAGMSLNDYLLKGPDLLQSLFGIMLRFRENRVALTADIEDMFLRVKIHSDDQHALRFLFRDDKGDIQTYMMSSLIFGANCSPFVAQYVKNKNTERFVKTMPRACDAIINSHYMDDYIDSVPDEETAVQLVNDVTYIHKQGNFHIRNWTTNNKTVINCIPKDALCDLAVRFKFGQPNGYEGERTLGLLWDPHTDLLKLDFSLKRIPECLINGTQNPTKRQVLKFIMSIFDVYGIFAPITIAGKIILQECWQTNIGWDDCMPSELQGKWQKWICLLKSLRNTSLPRYYMAASIIAGENERSSRCDAPAPGLAPAIHTYTYMNLQLHTFCDSSLSAMSAVCYWRWIDANNKVYVTFVASKCRVAPVKPVTVPRLELQAAVIAARLADSVLREHRIKPQQKYFWSDSSTVLYWIKNHTRNYKIFVANRLGEIDDLTSAHEWRYVPTQLNSADIATRENCDITTLPNEWLYGPAFLRNPERDWPADITQSENKHEKLEYVSLITYFKEDDFSIPEPTRFSSWLKLVRAMFIVLKFINKTRKIITEDITLINKAEQFLLRYSQAKAFGNEIDKIKKGEYLPKSSKLLTLTPFLDCHGILRVGGRIDAAADITPETKNPVILDGADYIARLIVRAYHVRAAHGHHEMVVNELKQTYWIIRLRPTVRSVVSKCMLCRLRKCKPEIPRFGDLPQARMAHHQRAFSFCGVDLFGPLEVTVGRHRVKRYGVLFTCLTVRAVHVEMVSSLSTDSLIMALRRMASRRGWPQQLFSDNGTNLRGADAELKKSMAQIDEGVLQNEALNRGIKWTFIPPASPQWGGAWERLIRSVKTALKVVLKERAPREETLATLLAEVENMVNSRPLVHVSVDPNSTESLTPNHFLIGSSSNLPRIGIFDDSDTYLRKQWRISQRLADMFWHRWVREVLPDMLPRRKWVTDKRSLQVGDFVLVADPNSPRNTWPRGIIEEILPGKDNRVRMVRLRTQLGTLTRSATRVIHIPVGTECC